MPAPAAIEPHGKVVLGTASETPEARSECAGTLSAATTVAGRATPVAAPVASAPTPTTRATVAAGT